MNEFGKAIAARFDADEFNPGWCVGSPVSHVLELFALAHSRAVAGTVGPLAVSAQARTIPQAALP